MPHEAPRFLVAEFFAGIGLVRAGLQTEGFDVVFANDISTDKMHLYAMNHGFTDFVLGDIRHITGAEVPDVSLATASFPCTDLSLAGNRAGLSGDESGLLWEFTRVLHEMGPRRPHSILIENVLGFATSHKGRDLRLAIDSLNSLGYWCDLVVVDARWFVPQSRPRLFIVGLQERLQYANYWDHSPLRPRVIQEFRKQNPDLQLQAAYLQPPGGSGLTLADVIEQLPTADKRWWDAERSSKFEESLSARQFERFTAMKASRTPSWATAYRRTRGGKAVWEIRADGISGCLRTSRGGSSRQAVVEAGNGVARVRWMTSREYARLQGVPTFTLGETMENKALFALGDAVCAPAVAWLAREYLRPVLVASGTKRAYQAPLPLYA